MKTRISALNSHLLSNITLSLFMELFWENVRGTISGVRKSLHKIYFMGKLFRPKVKTCAAAEKRFSLSLSSFLTIH